MSRDFAPISRFVLRPIGIQWWQPGKAEPLNCTGLNCSTAETSLPWLPAIEPVALATGRFQVAAPRADQAARLIKDRHYYLRIIMRNGAGAAVEEFEFGLIAR